MKIQDVLKPQFLSDKEMEIKEKNLSFEEKKRIVSEMVNLVKKNIEIEKEIEVQENVYHF